MRTIAFLTSSALIWSVSFAQETKQAPATPAPAASQQKAAVAPGSTATMQKPAAVNKAPARQPAAVSSSRGGPGLSVFRAAIARGLAENEPVEAGDVFTSDVKRLFCFSQIRGAQDSAEIQHRWYWNDDLISSIPLKVRSANWRTYSIKTIPPGMTGEWMVSIVATEKEQILQTLKFTVK